MKKRERIRNKLIEAFVEYEKPAMIPMDITYRRGKLVDAILDAIQDPPPKPKNRGTSPSATMAVFDAWADSVMARHKILPERNAHWTKNASDLVARVGQEQAVELVQFYVRQNDAFYLRTIHDLRHAVKDFHVLIARMKTGRIVTSGSAKKTEAAQTTARSSQSYLERKYGK